MLKHILLVGLLSFSALPLLKAQSCGNDRSIICLTRIHM